jgi:plastocyanin
MDSLFLRKILVIIFSSIIFAFSLGNVAFAKTYFNHRVVVLMYDNYFCPATITVHPYQKITWVNMGKHHHTVTGACFDSGHIDSGGRYSLRFNGPGVYYYKCTLHSFLFFGMTGKVIVN